MTFESPCATETGLLSLQGEIGPGAVIALRRQMSAMLDAGQPRIVVDLSAVTVLGGPTLSLLGGVLRLANRRGQIEIAGGPPRVHQLLTASHSTNWGSR